MSWIKVQDRLPEEKQDVIYYFKETGVHCGRFKKEPDPAGQDFTYDCFYGLDGFLCDDVTHWMPLPDAPKEDR